MIFRQKPLEVHNAIDRSQLVEIRRRFLLLNDQRLNRVRASLSDRQHIFLDALPLLLHCNHPMLPGFVTKSTPAGLSGFKVTKNQIVYGRQLSRSLNLATQPNAQPDIFGIFLMGSLGSIAHSSSSDFDIWICFNPELSDKAQQELNQKLLNISRWAASLGLEVHFFLMNDAAFRAGQMLSMSSESSGTAQRLLLLDEFYRTSLWLGGRLPLWWFIPADVDEAGEYEARAAILQTRRFINGEEFLDFGSCARIPANEFVGAGLWQLYKSIESPYKSVLKLLLLEVYVDQYQHFKPLSSEFKQAVYDGELDLDTLDPYILAYNRIADYLVQQGDSARLELLRRSLYFKVDKALSRPFTGKQKSWQRVRLETLVKQWDWRPAHVSHLDDRARWKALDVINEQEQLVEALTQAFNELDQFAKLSGAPMAIAGLDFLLLRNKLTAAFVSRPGKIVSINPGISRDISSDHLQLNKISTSNWQLRNPDQHEVLEQQTSLCSLLVWGIFNGVILPRTLLEVKTDITLSQVSRVRSIISQWLLSYAKPVEHHSFSLPSQVSHILLLVNWQEASDTPVATVAQLSDKFDPFNYGPGGENRVLSIDVVCRNSWGEIFHCVFSGRDVLFGLLKWYWQIYSSAEQREPPILAIEVFDYQQATSIGQRLNYWLQDIVQCFSRHSGRQSRYLFALGRQLFCLQWQNDELLPLTIYSEADLWNFLAVPTPVFRPMIIDRYCLQGHMLRSLIKHIQPGAVSIFYQTFDAGIAIVVVDELGCFVRMHVDQAPKLRSLFNLFSFIRASLDRVVKHNPRLLMGFGVVPMTFFEMQLSPHGWQLSRKNFDVDPAEFSVLPIKVVVQAAADDNYIDPSLYRFYCEGRLFEQQGGREAIQHLAAYVQTKRARQAAYPVFISEIEFTERTAHEQTLLYLKAKIAVESLLNTELAKLANTENI